MLRMGIEYENLNDVGVRVAGEKKLGRNWSGCRAFLCFRGSITGPCCEAHRRSRAEISQSRKLWIQRIEVGLVIAWSWAVGK